jgi:hypothetical protein
VQHRYVHGGLACTNARFSVYLSPAESYGGRFFQHITPVPDGENPAQEQAPVETNKIGPPIAGGAYFLETDGNRRTRGSM